MSEKNVTTPDGNLPSKKGRPRKGDGLKWSKKHQSWTARPTLVFVLPETGELTLARLHGRRVDGPYYGFGSHEPALLAAPWTPASLDLTSQRDARERREKLMRIVLFAVLGVGAAALLWILARNLRGTPTGADN